MNNKITYKRISFLTSTLVILFFLIASIFLLLIPSKIVYADSNDMLIVKDMSDDCATIKK